MSDSAVNKNTLSRDIPILVERSQMSPEAVNLAVFYTKEALEEIPLLEAQFISQRRVETSEAELLTAVSTVDPVFHYQVTYQSTSTSNNSPAADGTFTQ